MYLRIAAAILFILGLYVYLTKTKCVIEGMKTPDEKENEKSRCPDLLIKEGNAFFLKNTKLADIPGVNPIRFNNLEEYTEFIKWQHSQGIDCPVLFLQKSNNAQGSTVYNAEQNPFLPNGGLPNAPGVPKRPGSNSNFFNNMKKGRSKLMDANQESGGPYNKNLYPSFDQQNQYIGLEVPLDKMFNESAPTVSGCSANAMNENWCGVEFSRKFVDAGNFAGNVVTRYKED